MNKNKILKISILFPIAFLVIYHITKLYNVHFGDDIVTTSEFLNSFESDFSISTILIIQSVLRFLIITSLLLILSKKKLGIIAMWISIGGLILSQFYIASESTNELIQYAYSGLKPLKGIVLPALITYLYNKIN